MRFFDRGDGLGKKYLRPLDEAVSAAGGFQRGEGSFVNPGHVQRLQIEAPRPGVPVGAPAASSPAGLASGVFATPSHIVGTTRLVFVSCGHAVFGAALRNAFSLATVSRPTKPTIRPLLQSVYGVNTPSPACDFVASLGKDECLAAIPGIPGHVLEFQARLEIHPQAGLVAAAGPADRGRDAADGLGEAPGGCERAEAAREGSGLGGRRVHQRDDRPAGFGARADRALPRRGQDDRGGRAAVHPRARAVSRR